jgi:GNAT superfamily N-acetyltransferase
MEEASVVRLLSTQVPEAGTVIGRAFWNDPLTLYVLPDETHRREAIGPWFESVVRYGDLFAEVYTTAQVLKGAAVWIPPDSGEMTDERWAAADSESGSAMALGEAAKKRLAHQFDHTDVSHEALMPMPHWYLMLIGVAPEWQGHGVGGALLQPGFARADTEGVPCYLETGTESNVRFYQGHGFAVVIEEEVPGGLYYWGMRRDPQ